jgi:hypothetical protein
MWGNNQDPLQPIMAFEPFMKYGLNFMGPIKPDAKPTGNQYILVAIGCTMKRVEVKTLRDNNVQNITKFNYKKIITYFGCPTHLVSD